MKTKETWRIVRSDLSKRDNSDIIQDIKLLLNDSNRNHQLINFYNIMISNDE